MNTIFSLLLVDPMSTVLLIIRMDYSETGFQKESRKETR